jgi:hypothetical protein
MSRPAEPFRVYVTGLRKQVQLLSYSILGAYGLLAVLVGLNHDSTWAVALLSVYTAYLLIYTLVMHWSIRHTEKRLFMEPLLDPSDLDDLETH